MRTCVLRLSGCVCVCMCMCVVYARVSVCVYKFNTIVVSLTLRLCIVLRLIVDTAINVPGCAKERSVSLEMSSTGGYDCDWFFGFGWWSGVVQKGSRRDGGAVCLPRESPSQPFLSSPESRACRLKREFPSSPFSWASSFRPRRISLSLSLAVFVSIKFHHLRASERRVSLPFVSGRRNNRATKSRIIIT